MAAILASQRPVDRWSVRAGRLAAIVAAIVVTGLLGQASAITVSKTSLIWLPTGIAVGLMFRWGIRACGGVYLGILLVELLGNAFSPVAVGVAITGTLGTMLAAWILRRVDLDPLLSHPRDALWLLFACALGMCVTATGGVYWLWWGGRTAPAAIPATWWVWWRGDLVGALLAAPLLISWSPAALRPLRRSWAETLGFAVVILAVMGTINFAWGRPGDPIGPVVLIIWAAMRYGVLGGTLTAFACSVLDAWAIAGRLGEFESEPSALSSLWVGMMTWTLINLMISVIQAASTRDRDALRSYLEQLEESERRAEHASQVKSQFLANMSHELRTPVAAILGFGEILVRSAPESTERADASRGLRLNGEHLLGLVEDILDISRIETGYSTVSPVPYAPATIVEEVYLVTRLHAEACGVLLERRIDEGLPGSCQIDPTRLRQVLVNLVNNAIKFSDRGRAVVIQASASASGPADAGELRFAVIDQGIGISAENLRKLFRPFSQVDESMTRRFGGTGLGLSLSARLVEAMGGAIRVESREGEGSRFTVTLPIVAAPAPALAPAPAGPQDDSTVRPPLRGRVLLVEDNPDIRRILRYHLTSAGLELDCAENGQEGVDRGRSGEFDVILMDVQMPVLDGYDAMAALRAAGVRTPMIALTAHASVTDRDRCRAAGCDDYLTKPIPRRILLDAIRRHLRPRQQH